MRYSVIMAGGSGTRLWPMSRSRQPKQETPDKATLVCPKDKAEDIKKVHQAVGEQFGEELL